LKGGEPLLRWDSLTRTIDYALSRAGEEQCVIRFGINSNATLLDVKKIEWINAHPIFLFLSYDGPARIHNRNRPTAGGRLSFDRVKRGIELYFREYSRPIKSCRMTVDLLQWTFAECLSDTLQPDFNDVSIGFDAKSLKSDPAEMRKALSGIAQLTDICR
jgi:sulfatase maturation enzyme AslB (radical SAM superfamily)